MITFNSLPLLLLLLVLVLVQFHLKKQLRFYEFQLEGGEVVVNFIDFISITIVQLTRGEKKENFFIFICATQVD